MEPRGSLPHSQGLHNEVLNSLYHSPNRIRVFKSRRLNCVGHVVRMEGGKSPFKISTGKLTGKTRLGRPSRMDLKENL